MRQLEEVAAALYVRRDRYAVTSSIQLDQIYATSQVLGQIITFKPSPNKAIVGDNAFAHGERHSPARHAGRTRRCC